MTKKKQKFNELPTVEAVKWRAENYFATTEDNKWTRAGICLALNVSPRVFSEMKKRQEYRDTCEWIETHIQHMYERRLATNNSTGAMFGLKQFGWSDRGEIHATVSGNITIEQILKGKKPKA